MAIVVAIGSVAGGSDELGAAVPGAAAVSGAAVTPVSGDEPAPDVLSEPEQAAATSMPNAATTATTDGPLRMAEE